MKFRNKKNGYKYQIKNNIFNKNICSFMPEIYREGKEKKEQIHDIKIS